MIKQRCLIINARLPLQTVLSRLSLNDEVRHQFVTKWSRHTETTLTNLYNYWIMG